MLLLLTFLLMAVVNLILSAAISPRGQNFYEVDFYPLDVITRFESTVVIPSAPLPNSDGSAFSWGQVSFWPAIMPGRPGTEPGGFIQTAVKESEPGVWALAPYYCCSGPGNLVPDYTVHPGEAFTNIYVTDEGDKWWQIRNDWSVSSGTPRNMHTTFNSSLIFDPWTYPAHKPDPPYVKATLAIEIHNNVNPYLAWNFGTVKWKHVLIEAYGDDAGWCKIDLGGNPSMVLKASPAVVSVGNGKVRCFFESIEFVTPIY